MMLENRLPFSERAFGDGSANRRYDSLERLVAWRVREGEYYIFYRVTSFREKTLPNGEKVYAPAAIVCAWTASGAEPDFEVREGASTESPTLQWTPQELETEVDLQFSRARRFDSTQGRWICDSPLGFEHGSENQFGYVQQQPDEHGAP